MKDFSGKKMNLAAMHLYMNDDTQVLRKQAFLKSYKPLNKMAFDDATGKKTSVISLIHYYLPNTKLDLIYSAVEIYKRLPLYMLFKKIMTTFNLTFSLNNKWLKDIGFNFETIEDLIRHGKPIILHFNNDGNKCYKNAIVIIYGILEFDDYRFLEIYDGTSNIKYYLDYNKLSTLSEIVY